MKKDRSETHYPYKIEFGMTLDGRIDEAIVTDENTGICRGTVVNSRLVYDSKAIDRVWHATFYGSTGMRVKESQYEKMSTAVAEVIKAATQTTDWKQFKPLVKMKGD